MRPKGSADRLEYRRPWAAQLLDEGKGVNEVARLVQVSPSSVSRWKAMKAPAGEAGLKAKPHPGRGGQLSPQDQDQLKQLLLQGPQAAGFDTALWTCGRVAQVIAPTFGVSYHPDHVGRLLHGLGFSCQYPQHRARERDEEAIRPWRLVEWPRIKKKPDKKGGPSPGSIRAALCCNPPVAEQGLCGATRPCTRCGIATIACRFRLPLRCRLSASGWVFIPNV